MASFIKAAAPWTGLIFAVFLWAMVEAAASIPMDYCSSLNTASMAANHSIYQSDGLCSDFCRDDYALAIVQSDSCWCSNFVPASAVQVSTGQCSNPCPGFPDDLCGGDGLYGYMLLSVQPSGTVGASSSSTTSKSSAKVTTTETVDQTFQSTVTYIPPSPSTASSDSSTTSSSTKTTDTSQTSTTQTPTVSTVTAGGTVRTVTVTPDPTALTSSPNVAGVTSTAGASSHGLSAGAAAGIAVAVICVFLFVAGVVAWLWIKRRRARRAEDEAGPTFSSQRGSSAGMTATPLTGEMSETRYYMGADGALPPEPTRRRSTLMPVDPRLDPFAKGIYNRAENKSHDSVNTIRDDQDYSRRIQEPPRVLRATNPDLNVD